MIAHEDVEEDADWISWLRHTAQVRSFLRHSAVCQTCGDLLSCTPAAAVDWNLQWETCHVRRLNVNPFNHFDMAVNSMSDWSLLSVTICAVSIMAWQLVCCQACHWHACLLHTLSDVSVMCFVM